MVRYKRYRRRSSRVIKMKFQSFFDISTRAGEMQIISVNAGGNDVIRRLAPFFGAYKYFKLGGVSFKLIPASTLPVDPSGLSYSENEPGVDPRDQLTPGMCRITNGEDVLEDISGMSADAQHALYDNMLLDPRWYKWMLQSGVKRFGKPRYWQVGQLHQDKWPGIVQNYPVVTGGQVLSTANRSISDVTGTGVVTRQVGGSSDLGLFQTGNRGVLGWLPTDGYNAVTLSADSTGKQPFIASVPSVELFKILMPPAYKTKYFYRAFVTETVYFKDPIVMNVNGYRPIDVFRVSDVPSPWTPSSYSALETDSQLNHKTGGNDGGN